MQTREILRALVFGCSLLLAPRTFAQHELIDPQPESGAESQPLPSSPHCSSATPTTGRTGAPKN
jgi:hypothetical protein